MLDIPSMSAIVAAIGVLVGVAIAVAELRNLVKTRQTDLVMTLYSTFGSREHMDAFTRLAAMEVTGFDEFTEKYPPGTTERTMIGSVCVFYEGIGVLLHRKLINIGLVDDLFSTPIIQLWEKIEPIAKGQRERWNRPQVWEWFEYLYREMEKREQHLASKTA